MTRLTDLHQHVWTEALLDALAARDVDAVLARGCVGGAVPATAPATRPAVPPRSTCTTR